MASSHPRPIVALSHKLAGLPGFDRGGRIRPGGGASSPPATRARPDRRPAPGAGRGTAVALRPGYYVVSPLGPDDGGDFGPHTPGTRRPVCRKRSTPASATARPLHRRGAAGRLPEPRRRLPAPGHAPIPWMQDFRCDGGEAVLQYTQPTGDAIVMDSQDELRLQVRPHGRSSGDNPNGAYLRVKPQTAGPDGLVAVVTCRVAMNSSWSAGSPGWRKTNSSPTATASSSTRRRAASTATRYSSTSRRLRRGIYLTAPGPQPAVLNNWVRCPFAHICRTHCPPRRPERPRRRTVEPHRRADRRRRPQGQHRRPGLRPRQPAQSRVP